MQVLPKLVDYGKFRPCLAELLALKQRLGCTSMRISFAGVPIQHIEQFDEYVQNGSNMARFHLRHYSQLQATDLRWLNELHYSNLVDCVQKRVVSALPGDLHRKFGQVKRVTVAGQPQQPEHLIGFLKEFRNLQALTVLTTLDEATYARLAIECPAIWSLEVRNTENRQSMEFILKFPNLYSFSTDLWLDAEFIRKVFAAFECFRLDYVGRYNIRAILKRKHGQRIELWRYEDDQEDDFNDLEEYLRCYGWDSQLEKIRATW